MEIILLVPVDIKMETVCTFAFLYHSLNESVLVHPHNPTALNIVSYSLSMLFNCVVYV